MRGLEKEFGEFTNAIRLELNRFVEAGLLNDEFVKNKRYYRANTKHPLFNDIQSMLQKMVGIDKIVENVTRRVGNLKSAYITGSFAEGTDSDTIELTLIGNNLDKAYIKKLTTKAEKLIDRKINYQLLTKEEMEQTLEGNPALLIWKKDGEK